MREIKIFLTISLFPMIVMAGSLRLPSIIGNHSILRQSSNVKLWGWGTSSYKIKIVCSWSPLDTTKAAIGADCSWEAIVKTPKGSYIGYDIQFISENEKIILHDILLGEVWLCSGQSNMEWNYSLGISDADDALKTCKNDRIRFFKVGASFNKFPQTSCNGLWQKCDSSTMKYFSSVAYFFGLKIHETLNVPVGLIGAYWGGTCVQSWTPQEVFENDSELQKVNEQMVPVRYAPQAPSILYNAMIYPLAPYGITGVIWYQGEQNALAICPESYGKVFKGLIKGWRELFNKDFPFYYVQIAPFSGYGGLNGALVREQQYASLSLPKTGMISVADLVDDVSNVHPKAKAQVGRRLANLALKEQYGISNIQPYSPRIESFSVKERNVYVKVSSAGELKCNGDIIENFEVAGNDKVFHPAKATYQADRTIILTSENVKVPESVRYCFSNDQIPNLVDMNGLPLLPFRSDNSNEPK